MSLTDIMSEANLHFWAEVALVMFVALFVGVVLYVFARRNRAAFDHASRLPLDDAPTRTGVQENSRHECR
jgi:cbb3-type cytochrome oxidase subunit 3